MNSRDAVIVDAVRTPVGKRNGSLAGWHPGDLSAHVLRALVDRNGIEPSVVDDVIWGCVQQVGEQAGNIGRYAVLGAGWPESIPGTTIDRQCGSSQQSIHFAAAGLVAGHYDAVVAGGVEVMSRVPMGAAVRNEFGRPGGLAVADRYGSKPFHQGIGAELIAQRWGLTRTQLDEFSLESHSKLAAATDAGLFESELCAVPSDSGAFDHDEGLRRGGSVESLAQLKPAFAEDGVVTAGSSSQISDGAAALLMMTGERAAELGLTPVARIHSVAVTADDPVVMLTAPIPATHLALRRAGLSIDDIGVCEVNEAFAPVPLAWQAETGADPKTLNPNGGAIAIGHPLGASGARIMTTMVHHMRRNGIRYGLQTMCEGGGMANATVVELLAS